MGEIKNRFRYAREQIKKETLTQVAEGSKLARSLLIDLESDKAKPRFPGYDKIKTLAEYYGVSMDWLCGILPEDDWHIAKNARIAGAYMGLNSEAIQTLHRSYEVGKRVYSEGVLYKDAFPEQIVYNFFIANPLARYFLKELYRYIMSDFKFAYRIPPKDENNAMDKNTDYLRPFPSKELYFLSLSQSADSLTGGVDLGLSENEIAEVFLIRLNKTIRELREEVHNNIQKEK